MKRLVVIAGVLSLAGVGPSLAQEADTLRKPSPTRPDSGVSFDFQGADLRVVLTALAEAAGLNIVYSELPDRTVTLRTAHPVSAEKVTDLLESVAKANGLTLGREAGVIRISPAEVQEEPATRKEADTTSAVGPPRLFVHRLAHANAETVAQTLQVLFGQGGAARGARVGDGPMSLSESLGRQAATGYESFTSSRQERPSAQPRPRPMADGEERNQSEQGQERNPRILLTGPVEIVPDSRTNAVLVLANESDFATIRSAIEKLDIRPLQVLIEVLIAEVRQSDNFAYGTTVDVPVGADEEGVGGTLTGLSMGDLVLEVLGIGSVDASAVLAALSSTSDVTILSRPLVMAQNNQEARILVGDQRPFVQLSRSLPTEDAVRDQVVQYRNVGTELRIRPTINRDGYVNLQVLQEVSSATTEIQFGAPVINTRESETDVLVKDGHTVVLGGLVDHQEELTKSGIPLLKDIPVLGGLFGSTQTRDVATELFIFLTPHVLTSDDEARQATENLKQGMEALKDRLPDPIPLIPHDTVPRPPLPSPDTVPTEAYDVPTIDEG